MPDTISVTVTDDLDQIAEQYRVVAAPLDGELLVTMVCHRCPTVLVTTNDTQLDQSTLTLADLVDQAANHEAEHHLDEHVATELTADELEERATELLTRANQLRAQEATA